MSQRDVIVVGNGVIGLALALAMGRAGRSVTVVGQSHPTPPSQAPDPMVYALNHASEHLLRSLGVWSEAVVCQAYSGVDVWDAQTGAELTFDAGMVAADHLGHMVSVPALRWQLWQAVQACGGVQVCVASTQALTSDASMATLQTDAGDIRGTLLVGADGGQSWVRQQVGGTSRIWPAHQMALTAVVRSEQPHKAVARQVFLPTGPLALLPYDATNLAVMVWSMDEPDAQAMRGRSQVQIAHEATVATAGCVGALTLRSPVQSFPLVNRHVRRYRYPRVVLVGDAAHQVHPLAGQGANLGLADVGALAHVLTQEGVFEQVQAHPSALAVLLGRYERQRRAANARVLYGCDALKRCFAWQHPWGQGLRAAGVRCVQRSRGFKQRLLAHALGVSRGVRKHDLLS